MYVCIYDPRGGEEDQGGNEMRSGDKERKRRKGRGVKWGEVGVRWERRDWGGEGRGGVDGFGKVSIQVK